MGNVPKEYSLKDSRQFKIFWIKRCCNIAKTIYSTVYALSMKDETLHLCFSKQDLGAKKVSLKVQNAVSRIILKSYTFYEYSFFGFEFL